MYLIRVSTIADANTPTSSTTVATTSQAYPTAAYVVLSLQQININVHIL
jgi:hypothetical protein